MGVIGFSKSNVESFDGSPRVCGGDPKKPKKGNKKELLELITLLINLTVAILGLIKEFLK